MNKFTAFRLKELNSLDSQSTFIYLLCRVYIFFYSIYDKD